LGRRRSAYAEVSGYALRGNGGAFPGRNFGIVGKTGWELQRGALRSGADPIAWAVDVR